MIRKLSKILLIVSCAVVFAVSTAGLANAQLLPWFDYDGGYTYTISDHKLSFDMTTIQSVVYLTGIPGFSDSLLGADVVFGDLFNSDSDPLVFGSSSGATGAVDFFIGKRNTSTWYLEATLSNFIIDTSCAGSSGCINENFGIANLTSFTFNNTISSQYLTDLESQVNAGYGVALSMNLGGPMNFTADESGLANGKIPVSPEPVSAILFLSGGALLVGRSYIRRRKR